MQFSCMYSPMSAFSSHVLSVRAICVLHLPVAPALYSICFTNILQYIQTPFVERSEYLIFFFITLLSKFAVGILSRLCWWTYILPLLGKYPHMELSRCSAGMFYLGKKLPKSSSRDLIIFHPHQQYVGILLAPQPQRHLVWPVF